LPEELFGIFFGEVDDGLFVSFLRMD
jgi:hypothetical protein